MPIAAISKAKESHVPRANILKKGKCPSNVCTLPFASFSHEIETNWNFRKIPGRIFLDLMAREYKYWVLGSRVSVSGVSLFDSI